MQKKCIKISDRGLKLRERAERTHQIAVLVIPRLLHFALALLFLAATGLQATHVVWHARHQHSSDRILSAHLSPPAGHSYESHASRSGHQSCTICTFFAQSNGVLPVRPGFERPRVASVHLSLSGAQEYIEIVDQSAVSRAPPLPV